MTERNEYIHLIIHQPVPTHRIQIPHRNSHAEQIQHAEQHPHEKHNADPVREDRDQVLRRVQQHREDAHDFPQHRRLVGEVPSRDVFAEGRSFDGGDGAFQHDSPGG